MGHLKGRRVSRNAVYVIDGGYWTKHAANIEFDELHRFHIDLPRPKCRKQRFVVPVILLVRSGFVVQHRVDDFIHLATIALTVGRECWCGSRVIGKRQCVANDIVLVLKHIIFRAADRPVIMLISSVTMSAPRSLRAKSRWRASITTTHSLELCLPISARGISPPHRTASNPSLAEALPHISTTNGKSIA